MKTSVYIILKYWKKHKKNLMSLMFSAVLLTAITLVYWLGQREIQNRYFEENIYSNGVEELMIFNSNDELRSTVLNENKRIKSASAYKFGDFSDFAFGTVDDPHNIMRITLESGRLPAAENEVAVDRAVLNALYWTGKTGDKISFDNKEYIVTGITDISLRNGSTLGINSVYNLLDGHDMPDCKTLPLILFSELEGSPQARIDYFSGIVSKKLTMEQAESSPEYTRILDALSEKLDYDKSFLTTTTGAEKMGLHNARYTDVFAAEEMDGSIFPSEAKMTMISIKQLKTQDFLKRLKNAVGIIMTLIVMSLLGFSAYFNGIAMKIRKSSYQISVLRAQGAPLSKIKKVLLYKNLKSPFLAVIFSYIALKAAQMSANSLCDKWDELWMSGDEFVEKLSETIFMRNNWWQTNLEIPTLIFLAVFSAITLILTVTSLRKFKGDIASDLNSGRTRQ